MASKTENRAIFSLHLPGYKRMMDRRARKDSVQVEKALNSIDSR